MQFEGAIVKRIFAVLFCLFVTSAVLAQDVKIGFVNTDRILRESGPALRATKKLDKEFASRDADIKKLADQVRSQQADLEKNGSTMPDADRRNKERELIKGQQELARVQREFREDFNNRRNEELAGIQERVNNTIQQIAETEKYDAILQEVLYINPKLDITDKVLKALADK
jgi:outer membrane protein